MKPKNTLLAVFLSAAIVFSGSVVANDCTDGAGNALKGDAIFTGLICAADLFFTLGASGVCAAKVIESMADAPVKMATGCALAATLGGEDNPAYEATQAIGNISDGIDTARNIGEIVQLAL